MGQASMRKWMRRAWVALEPVRAKYGHPGPGSVIQFPVRATALRMRREHRRARQRARRERMWAAIGAALTAELPEYLARAIASPWPGRSQGAWSRLSRMDKTYERPLRLVAITQASVQVGTLSPTQTCADLAPAGWVCEEHGASGVVGCYGPWMPATSTTIPEISHG
ncbi:MAG TPA: hypothetical protein VFP50_15310 [Anaeromyxobacteraceae bacterium]|nr:hypothetical protein [Anaeromyxobacteraceae bacterium]